MANLSIRGLVLAAVVSAADPASLLYSLTAESSPDPVEAHGRGQLHIYLTPSASAHVSKDTPFKIDLSAQGAHFEKEHLRRVDAIADSPLHFRADFIAGDRGKAQLSAKATFFICTEKLCIRQQKQLSVDKIIQ